MPYAVSDVELERTYVVLLSYRIARFSRVALGAWT